MMIKLRSNVFLLLGVAAVILLSFYAFKITHPAFHSPFTAKVVIGIENKIVGKELIIRTKYFSPWYDPFESYHLESLALSLPPSIFRSEAIDDEFTKLLGEAELWVKLMPPGEFWANSVSEDYWERLEKDKLTEIHSQHPGYKKFEDVWEPGAQRRKYYLVSDTEIIRCVANCAVSGIVMDVAAYQVSFPSTLLPKVEMVAGEIQELITKWASN